MVTIFQGDYFFLSNFFLSDMKIRESIYKSAEHLYQAVKVSEKSDSEKIRDSATSKSAKILGRFFKIRPHWDVDKIRVMERILRLKFRKAKLRRLLRETGDKQLINQNYYHETFWGVCGCTKHQRTGQNMLGKILMKIRADFINQSSMNK